MSTYTDIENQIKTLIYENMSDRYPEELVHTGDLDKAYKTSMGGYWGSKPRFCVLNFDGGRADSDSVTFTSRVVWRHFTEVHFYVAYVNSTQIEEDMRADYDSFVTLIAGNSRCLGSNRRMTVTRCYRPEVHTLDSQPFVLLRFVVETLEQL